MCSAFERGIGIALLLLAGCDGGSAATDPVAPATAPAVPSRTALTVCADPNNLPFSNRRGEGFENRIAELIAAELGLPLRYYWWPQRRGFARNTLEAGVCDLIAGVPAGPSQNGTTRPYYTSTYVFVTRADAGLDLRSFDDPRLRRLRIGLHAIGDDYGSVPPALALAARGIVHNLRGYSVLGDYAQADPPARLIEAVVRGEIDVAIAWGPLAGFFAQRAAVPLRLTPVDDAAAAQLPMQFAMAMTVRPSDVALRARLDQILARRRAVIEGVLKAYGVPIVPVSARALRVDRAAP